MKRLLFIGLLMLWPSLLPAASAQNVAERLVPLGYGISGEEIYVNSLKISPDFKHIGYVSRIGGSFRVWLDGVSEKSHMGVTRQSPFFSPQQNRLAYIAQDKEDMFVVVDNQEHDRYKQVGTLTFSSDGSRLAYRAEDHQGDQMIVVDGKPGPKFEVGVSNTPGIVFSPDSKHLAYVGISGNNAAIFVKDNKKLESFEKIDQIKFSPDSKHVAYSAMEKGKWMVVKDDRKGPAYNAAGNLVFSPDGSQLVYMAEKNRRRIVVRNQEEITGEAGALFPAFSPDGSRFAFLSIRKGGKFSYVIDGKAELAVDIPGRLIFSHDGSSTAYAARFGDKWHVVKDGVKGPAFKKIAAFSFSPATNDILYAADNDEGKTCVVKNTMPGAFYDAIGAPVFSQDGGQYAHAARRTDSEMFMVVNGVEQKPYPLIGIPFNEETGQPQMTAQQPFFSEKGNRLAYPVYDVKLTKAFMVVDGKPQAQFDAIMEPIFSADEKHVAYMAKRDNKWFMVVDGQPGSLTCDGMIRGATIAYDPSTHCFFILVASKKEAGLAFFRLEAEIKKTS